MLIVKLSPSPRFFSSDFLAVLKRREPRPPSELHFLPRFLQVSAPEVRLGDIALTLENINDVGLIAIYETVLNRVRSFTFDNPTYISDPGVSDALLLAALARDSVRDAAAAVAEATGQPRRKVYARALELAKQEADR